MEMQLNKLHRIFFFFFYSYQKAFADTLHSPRIHKGLVFVERAFKPKRPFTIRINWTFVTFIDVRQYNNIRKNKKKMIN